MLPILGEHDYKAQYLLGEINDVLSGKTPDPEVMEEVSEWLSEGGKNTVEGFRSLDEDMREGVIDYLSDMALYEEATIKGVRYILVHAGIADFDPSTPLDEYMPEDFISEPLDPNGKYFDDAIIIAGHTPTSKLGGNGRIIHADGIKLIDCGASEGGHLACLCLETGEEFYV